MPATPLPPHAIIAMIHVRALPGTPRHADPIETIVRNAVDEARLYESAAVDALLIENMHDLPYVCDGVGPEIVAGMTAVGAAVRGATRLPLGVQVLAAANREALAVALAVGAAFVRVENFTYAHVADEGLMARADAGPLLRYRRQIGAAHIAIAADVKKKHASHAITSDVDLSEAARTAEWCGADAVIVTGGSTGEAPALTDVTQARTAARGALWIGSGVTDANLAAYWPHADALVVGSHFKRDGLWSAEIDADRVRAFVARAAALRRG